MSERNVCTFCGRDGHRASQCPQRRAAVLRAQVADAAAGLLLATTTAARWLHGRPDVLTTSAALIAAAAALYLIHAGA